MLMLGLQLFVGLLVPLAEARADERAAVQRSHVEESGSQSCAPVHDPAACEVCRALRLAGEPGQAGAARLAAGDCLTVVPASIGRNARDDQRPASSRAPPVA